MLRFSLAELVARLNRLPLAPLYLSSLYARLDECSRWVFKSVGQYAMVSYIDASFPQVFLLERFGALSPRPVELELLKPHKVIIGGVGKEKTSRHKPRALRLSEVKPEEGRKPPCKLIDFEKSFNFRPYAYTSRGVTPNLFHAESSEEIRWFLEGTYRLALLLIGVVAPALLPSKLGSSESTMSYSPKPILR